MRQDLGLAATMLSRAEPRTIQAVLSCGTKNCSSVTKAMGHFQSLYPTAGAEGASKSILPRVGNCVSGCAEAGEFEAEDPKPKPGGIPLASQSGREGRGVLGTGGRPRGPRSEMSDVSGTRGLWCGSRSTKNFKHGSATRCGAVCAMHVIHAVSWTVPGGLLVCSARSRRSACCFRIWLR